MDKINQIIESGVLEDYLMGVLSDQDSAKVESYLSTYPELRNYMQGLEKGVERMARENAVTPAPELKSKILQAVSQPEKSITSASSTSQWWKIAAGFFVGMGLTALFLFNQMGTHSKEIETLKTSISNLENECQEAQAFLEKNKQLIFFLKHKATVPVQIDQGKTNMIIYNNPIAKQTKLKIEDMPAIASSETFQMWADVEGEMLNMGTFSTSDDYLDLKYIADAESFNITIEPNGGSEVPTVSKIIASKKLS